MRNGFRRNRHPSLRRYRQTLRGIPCFGAGHKIATLLWVHFWCVVFLWFGCRCGSVSVWGNRSSWLFPRNRELLTIRWNWARICFRHLRFLPICRCLNLPVWYESRYSDVFSSVWKCRLWDVVRSIFPRQGRFVVPSFELKVPILRSSHLCIRYRWWASFHRCWLPIQHAIRVWNPLPSRCWIFYRDWRSLLPLVAFGWPWWGRWWSFWPCNHIRRPLVENIWIFSRYDYREYRENATIRATWHRGLVTRPLILSNRPMRFPPGALQQRALCRWSKNISGPTRWCYIVRRSPQYAIFSFFINELNLRGYKKYTEGKSTDNNWIEKAETVSKCNNVRLYKDLTFFWVYLLNILQVISI